jgi:hypothetical protein
MNRFSSVFVALLISTVLVMDVQAGDSAESVGYQIYTLGVQAAKANDPNVKAQLMQQIKLLQERRDQLIAQGAAPTVNDGPATVTSPVPASPPVAYAPATNWSQGSYRNFRGPVSYGGAPHYGSYRVNTSPFAGTGFSMGLQPPNPFTIGGYRYWKGPQFNWGSYPIRFR